MRLPHSNESSKLCSSGTAEASAVRDFLDSQSSACKARRSAKSPAHVNRRALVVSLFTEPRSIAVMAVLQLGLYPLAMHPKASKCHFETKKVQQILEFQWVQGHCLNSAPTQIVLSRSSKTRPVGFLTPFSGPQDRHVLPFLSIKTLAKSFPAPAIAHQEKLFLMPSSLSKRSGLVQDSFLQRGRKTWNNCLVPVTTGWRYLINTHLNVVIPHCFSSSATFPPKCWHCCCKA